MWTRGSHEIKDLKSGESSEKSEKVGCFGLTMVLEGAVTPDVDNGT